MKVLGVGWLGADSTDTGVALPQPNPQARRECATLIDRLIIRERGAQLTPMLDQIVKST
jgi:hypothetical protein